MPIIRLIRKEEMMANPVECRICQQVPDAAFVVTCRWDAVQFNDQAVNGVCIDCFILLAKGLEQALQAQRAEEEAFRLQWEADHPEEAALEVQDAPSSVGAEPGVLEQVEAEEGRVHPAPQSASSKRRKKTDQELITETPAEEAEAADVDG